LRVLGLVWDVVDYRTVTEKNANKSAAEGA
jgi:hypothetical protein